MIHDVKCNYMILKSNHGPQQSVALRCHQQALASRLRFRRTLDFQVVQFVHRRGVKAFGVSSCLSLSLAVKTWVLLASSMSLLCGPLGLGNASNFQASVGLSRKKVPPVR